MRYLTNILRSSMHRLKRHARRVGRPNVDESTFRSFFLAELKRCYPRAKCQTEWRWFDLMVTGTGRPTLIEFKFWVYRRTFDVDGAPLGWKGGAGPKNESEFYACLDKLRKFKDKRLASRYLVLVYENGPPRKGKYSLELSYGSLKPGRGISRVTRIRHAMDDIMTCKLIHVK